MFFDRPEPNAWSIFIVLHCIMWSREWFDPVSMILSVGNTEIIHVSLAAVDNVLSLLSVQFVNTMLELCWGRRKELCAGCTIVYLRFCHSVRVNEFLSSSRAIISFLTFDPHVTHLSKFATSFLLLFFSQLINGVMNSGITCFPL